MARSYRDLDEAAVRTAVERLGLGRYLTVRTGALSAGNRQRLALALALAHRPDLLVLDEPVNGLDPAGVVEVRELLRELADSGVTVFMSTHLLSEVARLADRVGIIHRGRLVEELSTEQLAAAGAERLVATVRDAAGARRAGEAVRRDGIAVDVDGHTLVSADPLAVTEPDRVASLLVGADAPPTYLCVEREDLERLFLRLTEEGS
jgi:ABC-2 type transport system ATP-binding protein